LNPFDSPEAVSFLDPERSHAYPTLKHAAHARTAERFFLDRNVDHQRPMGQLSNVTNPVT